VPFAIVLSALGLLPLAEARLDAAGVAYALASGAITSGLGYAIWYTVLPALKATSAATVQLSVPVIAALSGIVFLGEAVTLRFVLASIAILGGIALVILNSPSRRG
jgi:drug/metabolite transporter (DMT)-like permease